MFLLLRAGASTQPCPVRGLPGRLPAMETDSDRFLGRTKRKCHKTLCQDKRLTGQCWVSEGSAEAMGDSGSHSLFSWLVRKAFYPVFNGDSSSGLRRHLYRKGRCAGKLGWACSLTVRRTQGWPKPSLLCETHLYLLYQEVQRAFPLILISASGVKLVSKLF